MNGILNFAWLLADRSRWERLGDAFTEENARLTMNELLALAGIGVAGLVLIVVLMVLARRQDEQRPYHDPERLFRQLCRLHRLTRKDRQLVRNLAGECGLELPSLMFVQPERFETAELVEQDVNRQDRIRRLRGQLFA